MSKISLVYILSNGRSGSTLLDLLLGSLPGVWTLGEAQMLPLIFNSQDNKCGCGESFRNCSFWEDIVPHVLSNNSPEYPIEYFRILDGGGKVLRYKQLPNLLSSFSNTSCSDAYKEYGSTNSVLFELAKTKAESLTGEPVQWLVDASKDPYRLMWLCNSNLFDIKVIHLYKDPRALVYSFVKKEPTITTQRVVRFTGRWLVENLLSNIVCKKLVDKKNVYVLRYEDLATDPTGTMINITKWLSLNPSSVDVTRFREVLNHGVSGNEMRWKNSSIRLDEAWRSNLPPQFARFSHLVCLPLKVYLDQLAA